jgi:hypothetical protein
MLTRVPHLPFVMPSENQEKQSEVGRFLDDDALLVEIGG